MTLQVKQHAPGFNTKDVFNNEISLHKFKGKKVYLAFMRFAGCPVCNLRVHELLKSAAAFKEKNIEVVLIYESTTENMRTYLEDENYPFTFIADSKNEIYNIYQVEKSWYRLVVSMFKGLIGKASAGEKLFKKKPAVDGKLNRLEADFLINENGTLAFAHYASFVGDHINIQKILNA